MHVCISPTDVSHICMYKFVGIIGGMYVRIFVVCITECVRVSVCTCNVCLCVRMNNVSMYLCANVYIGYVCLIYVTVCHGRYVRRHVSIL